MPNIFPNVAPWLVNSSQESNMIIPGLVITSLNVNCPLAFVKVSLGPHYPTSWCLVTSFHPNNKHVLIDIRTIIQGPWANLICALTGQD